MRAELRFTLNGAAVETFVRPQARLLDVLRDTLGATGTKEGCSEGECGACTVIVDGRAVAACLFPALEAEGRTVVTVEGLRQDDGEPSEVQRAFIDKGGVQCGFCTPGMVMAATALLAENPAPTDDEIRAGLVGNLCRCTGYVQIVDAVKQAADELARKERP
ncbi:MAG: (2Fe-2S)-binding protein [Deltaproteobacteria bacterium RBG_16_71_12]|nr:MAG: (2Fe-2S)-binding protein [Deltaproteobacteria bacterium RBG_16_71_12]